MKRPYLDVINVILGGINLLVFGVFVAYMMAGGFGLLLDKESLGLITVLVTCIAVVLTGVTVFIALAGFFSYNKIEEKAVIAAENAATEIAIEKIDELQTRDNRLKQKENILEEKDNQLDGKLKKAKKLIDELQNETE